MKKENLNPQVLLNKKFATEISGYKASEVDEFMDRIIKDYNNFIEEREIRTDKINDLSKLLSDRDNRINDLETELEAIKNQLKETERATNADLMREISEIKEKLK